MAADTNDRLHITVKPDEVTVEVRGGETILGALARAGFKYRIGCKRGGCGVCKVALLAGEVTYERPIAESVLCDDEKVEGICVTCRAVPATSVTIELQDGDILRRLLPLGFLAGVTHERDARDEQLATHQPRKG